MPNNPLGSVILDIEGVELKAEEREILNHPQVGGLILFSRNFEDVMQLRELVRQVRETRPHLNISVDHEGGRVQRFRSGFTRLPPMQKLDRLYSQNSKIAKNAAHELGWLMAAELVACDIDLSYAPVLDLDDHTSDIIGDRSFSPDPDIAIELCGAFIDGMHEAGMSATGKHFPGHGGVKADSHLELPIDGRELAELESHDLRPFRELSDKLDAVMSAHMVFPRVDTELVSFSKHWLGAVLREQLGFTGIVFSDDLTMEGAAGAGDFPTRAYRALDAGCDVILVCNNRKGAIDIIETLERDAKVRPNDCLSRMNKNKKLSGQDLKKSERWQRAVDIAEQLI